MIGVHQYLWVGIIEYLDMSRNLNAVKSDTQ